MTVSVYSPSMSKAGAGGVGPAGEAGTIGKSSQPDASGAKHEGGQEGSSRHTHLQRELTCSRTWISANEEGNG